MNDKKPPRIAVQFTQEEYEQIQNIAEKTKTSLGSTVRNLTKPSLDLQVTEDNLNFICKIIRQELNSTMQINFERLSSLLVKVAMMSTTSAYLNAEAINKFVPIEEQEEMQLALEKSKLKALRYIKKNNDFSDW